MRDSSPLFWPVAELTLAYSSGQLSPVEVTHEALARIEAIDGELHAYLAVTGEAALEQARGAEAAYRDGTQTAALLGVPVSIKDLFEMKGTRTTLGSLVYRDQIADRDAGVVRALRNHGAVLIGKTNTAEFGQSATTENLLGPGCGNPWGADRTAGGSSGGAAASVGAGMASMALGSDGGGSIRIPAAMCGLFGIKPTLGQGSDENSFRAMTDFVCAGPITRRVADARPFLAATLDGRYSRRTVRKSLRIAWCPAPEGRPLELGVAATARKAVEKLNALGHRIEETELPLHGWQDCFGPLVLADEWRYRRHLLDVHADRLTAYARRGIEAAALLTDVELDAARTLMSELRERIKGLFDVYDLIVTPTTATVAFPIERRPREIAGREVDSLWGAFPFTAPFNVSGSPAASLPCGLSDGLPVGLQLVAADRQEQLLLDVCENLEEAVAFPVDEPARRWAIGTAPTETQVVAPRSVRVEREGSVAVVRLARKDKRNALSRSMLSELRQALDAAARSGAGAVVLTGSDSLFSAGVDLTEVGHGLRDLEVDEEVAMTAGAIRSLGIPVVAAVEGPCLGAALELVLACDVRIAGRESVFSLPAAQLGLLYRPDGVLSVFHELGGQTTARLLLLGERIGADDALTAGIASRVVAAGDAARVAQRIAGGVEEASPAATRATKGLLQAILRGDTELSAWDGPRRALLESCERREAVARAAAGMSAQEKK